MDRILVRGKILLRFFFFSLLHCADILSLVSGAALVQVPDSRSLFRGARTATAIDPACRSANLFGRTVSHFFLPATSVVLPRFTPNQSMKPTAPLRRNFGVFATTPCRGLSLSR